LIDFRVETPRDSCRGIASTPQDFEFGFSEMGSQRSQGIGLTLCSDLIHYMIMVVIKALRGEQIAGSGIKFINSIS
jgi:hypothetical protein